MPARKDCLSFLAGHEMAHIPEYPESAEQQSGQNQEADALEQGYFRQSEYVGQEHVPQPHG